MRADVSLWDELTKFNDLADSMVEKALKFVEPTQPISREIPFYASLEVRFDHLPESLAAPPPLASAILSGNNTKRGIFENGGSRVYVRELAFSEYFVTPANDSRTGWPSGGRFPPNWRWNFSTSITQRRYSDRNVSAGAGGRVQAGNHLSFRDPLVIEPRETFIFDCELLNYMGPTASFVVAMYLSGYREGM